MEWEEKNLWMDQFMMDIGKMACSMGKVYATGLTEKDMKVAWNLAIKMGLVPNIAKIDRFNKQYGYGVS